MNSPEIYGTIAQRLEAAKKKHLRALLLEGILTACLVLSVAAAVVVLAEAVFLFDAVVRTVLVTLLALLFLILAIRFVVLPALRYAGILRSETLEETAGRVGKTFPLINDHLVNILQLYREREQGRLYSVELIDASFADIRREIDSVDFSSITDHQNSKRLGKWLAGIAGAGVLLLVLLPSLFLGSVDRLWHFGQSYAAPVPFRLLVEPGDREVVKGESVQITIRVEGQPQQSVTLASKPEGQVDYEQVNLEPTPEGVFVHEMRSLKTTTRYFASAGEVTSGEYKLTVLDRPIVKILRVGMAFPRYAALPARQLDDNIGDVAALKGTRLTFTIEANKELGSAALVFGDRTTVPLSVSGTGASGSLVLLKEGSYHIMLLDTEGLTNTDPIEYTLRILPDAYPAATILVPGTNIDIAENVALNMLFKITDDYGFTSLRLAHKLIQSRYEKPAAEYSFTPIPIPEGTKTEGTVAHTWSLSRLSLVPEDVVSYYIEVFDNDHVSGPKSARSETYTLRLPSLDEVFADLDRGHDVSLESMKEALKDAQEAKKELDELQQQMKRNHQKLDWQEQKRAEQLLEKYEQIQKKLDEVNKTVDQMVEEMQRNEVLSRETLEKYQELQQLMEEMNSPELAEALKKLQKAMEQLSPEALKQALQQFTMNEEMFRKSIERTLDLLKRIQIEQKVDELVKRAGEWEKQQRELKDRTEQTNPQDQNRLDNIAQQQSDLQKQIEQMQREMAELQKKMEDFPTEMPLEELAEAREGLEQSQLQEQMQRIAQQMQQQQMQMAMQNQQQAMQKMEQFTQQMQAMQQAMRDRQEQQIANEMRRAMQDLLELSKRQEDLKNQAQGMDQASPQFRENAQKQMEALRDLGKVADHMSGLAKKTFGVTPEMGKSIGDAMRSMQEAMESLDQRNGASAAQHQGGAMASLNDAARQVESAMEAMRRGGMAGMGMMGLMQRMQGITGMQQGVNEGTQNLGGLTNAQAAELGRLAGQQGMVRKSLEQLAREAAGTGELSKMLGDLNSIAREMREVQTDLAQGNVNPETLRKQERILSRLLDSQRSARERDYERRRRAETGQDIKRQSPGSIDLTTQEGRNRLRQDLLKAMEEGYAKDYEDLIRKYFESLEKHEKQN